MAAADQERPISEEEMARLARVLVEVEETGDVTVSTDGGGIEVLPNVPAAVEVKRALSKTMNDSNKKSGSDSQLADRVAV